MRIFVLLTQEIATPSGRGTAAAAICLVQFLKRVGECKKIGKKPANKKIPLLIKPIPASSAAPGILLMTG
jgi:hypothetical protein